MAEKKPTTQKPQPALSITSSREGFRRAGRSFGREATVILLSDLSKDEIALLLGEAMLTVTKVDVADAVIAADDSDDSDDADKASE